MPTPGPDVASFRRGLGRLLDVPRLGVDEFPDLVDLHALGPDTAYVLVVVVDARAAGVDEELGDRVDGDAGDPADGPKRRPLDEHPEYRRAPCRAQPVHNQNDTGSKALWSINTASLKDLLFRWAWREM